MMTANEERANQIVITNALECDLPDNGKVVRMRYSSLKRAIAKALDEAEKRGQYKERPMRHGA